jgi:hypothetical protein
VKPKKETAKDSSSPAKAKSVKSEKSERPALVEIQEPIQQRPVAVGSLLRVHRTDPNLPCFKAKRLQDERIADFMKNFAVPQQP